MAGSSRTDYPYAVVPELPDDEQVDLDRWLPGPGPLEIEIGPGRGAFLLERCRAAPTARLLGIEIRRKWARIVDDRLQDQGHRSRARVVCHDAKLALPRLGPEGAVAAAFLHFPDPWWKKRHQKRLVVVEPLIDELCRLLGDGATLFVQTDVRARAVEYAQRLGTRAELAPDGDRSGSAELSNNPFGARSNRERRAEADGLPIHRLRYRRRPRP